MSIKFNYERGLFIRLQHDAALTIETIHSRKEYGTVNKHYEYDGT